MALHVNGGPLQFDAVIDGSQFQTTIKQMEAQLKSLTKSTGQHAKEVDAFSKSVTRSLAGLGALMGGTDLIRQIANVRSEFAKLEAVLTNATGSNTLAKSLLGQIKDYAANTPFQFKDIADSFVKLVNQGFTPTRKELEALGDLAASTGKEFGQLAEAILDAQQGEGERLKEFGIRMESAGDKARFTFKGVTTEVDKSAAAIRNYIIGLGELQGVAGSTAAISATLGGAISNLRDSWDNMLASIGEESEGAFMAGIEGAKLLIDNYGKVIDALKVIAITFGTYKAAVIATTLATSGLTAAEVLHYYWLEAIKKAQLALNFVMKANPYVAVATALAGVVSYMIIFGREASQVKSKVDLLADAQDKLAEGFSDKEAKLRSYLEILKAGNVTEEQRLDIYNKIKAIDPAIVQGIDAKALSYQNLADRVAAYLKELRKQMALEANEEAVKSSVKQEQNLQKQIDAKRKSLKSFQDALQRTGKDELPSAAKNSAKQFIQSLTVEIADLEALHEKQKAVTASIAGERETLNEGPATDGKKPRSLEVIESEIKALKELQQQQSTTRKEYLDFQKKIAALEKERETITGKAAAKAAVTAQKAYDSRLDQLKALEESIADAERDAARSGMVKEESEIDRINQRFDELLKKGKELKASEGLLKRIGAAKDTMVDNAAQKQQAAEYTKYIDLQREAFDRFEEYKLDVGTQKAKELLDGQLAEYDNYLDFLRAQLDSLRNDKSIGGQLKFSAVSKEFDRAATEQANREIENHRRVLQSSMSVMEERLAIERQYEKELSILKKQYLDNGNKEEFERRKRVLDAAKDDDLKDLGTYIATQRDAYKALNKDIIDFTKERIQQEIEVLKNRLQTDTGLSADMKKAIEKAIAEWEKVNRSIDKSIDKAEEFTRGIGAARNAFSTLTDAASLFDDELAGAFNSIGNLIGAFEDLQKAMDALDSAEQAGKNAIDGIMKSADLITAVVKAVIAAVNVIAKDLKKVKETKKQSKEEVEAFYSGIIAGEQQINELMRQRQRDQSALNKLTYERIDAERALLEEQKKAVQDQASALMKQLQGESFISGEKVKKKSFWDDGIGRRRYVEKEYQSLLNKSFEEIEGLYLKGQLDGKAKELFEQLQKLKQEGADIDRMLEENKREAAQIFTGTTADTIADSIVQGFKQGKRTIQDFAQDFQSLMQDALLNALKYQAIEEPLKAFYEQFAADAQSGGALTQSEVASLKQQYNDLIASAGKQFEELQKVTGVNVSAATGGSAGINSLQGAIRGMTEAQSELLAGQLGGMRLSNLELLKVAQQNLNIQTRIQANTAATVERLAEVARVLSSAAGGSAPLHVKVR